VSGNHQSTLSPAQPRIRGLFKISFASLFLLLIIAFIGIAYTYNHIIRLSLSLSLLLLHIACYLLPLLLHPLGWRQRKGEAIAALRYNDRPYDHRPWTEDEEPKFKLMVETGCVAGSGNLHAAFRWRRVQEINTKAHELIGATSTGSDEDGSEESDSSEESDEGSADGGGGDGGGGDGGCGTGGGGGSNGDSGSGGGGEGVDGGSRGGSKGVSSRRSSSSGTNFQQ
jgi:hypothetical protein